MSSKDQSEDRKSSEFIFLQVSGKHPLTASDKGEKTPSPLGVLAVEEGNEHYEQCCYIKGYS